MSGALITLTVKGLTYSERPTGAYALLLESEVDKRRLPIVIGAFEAQAIAIALDKMSTPPRPMTHDLFQTMLAAFHVQIREVTLTALEEGIFRATLVCEQEGHEWRFDARPSDAIAMALRQQAPLFATQEVVRSAGEQMDNGASETSAPAAPAIHSEQPTDQLHKDLQEALTNEDYERAASLRDELQRRGAL